jgi:translation initiation factor 2B subunit (eIF-2B alpha/beta/delta family)
MDVVELIRRIGLIAADRVSGASDLLRTAAGIVDEGLRIGAPIPPMASALCRAQPSMAPLWVLAAEALAAERAPERWARFLQRLERAPRGLARWAIDGFGGDGSTGPIHLVTISSSSAVLLAVRALAEHRPVRLSCAESRPALEGRALAARLAAAGIPVTVFGDAAIAEALSGADAVLVGADAIAPDWFVNKCGTRMLASAAAHRGTPVYVTATRDKFVGETIAARLRIREGDAAEIWDTPPPGIEVRNPYFESTPLDLVTAVITDGGVLGAALVPDVCEAALDTASVQALIEVLDGRG